MTLNCISEALERTIKPQILSEITSKILVRNVDTSEKMYNDAPFAFDQVEIALLSECNLQILKEKVIGAAILRKAGYTLYMHSSVVDPTQDWKIKTGTQLYVENEMIKRQIENINPNIQVQVTSKDSLQSHLNIGCQAFITESINNIVDLGDEWLVLPLTPLELVPHAGQGTFVFLLPKGNNELRRKIAQFHDPYISALTNIEREISAESPFPIHIHISQIKDGFQVALAWLKEDTLTTKVFRRSTLVNIESYIHSIIE